MAINLENCVLAQKNSETGSIDGVSVRLAETFADELGLALEFIEFPAAGKVVDPAQSWQRSGYICLMPCLLTTIFSPGTRLQDEPFLCCVNCDKVYLHAMLRVIR